MKKAWFLIISIFLIILVGGAGTAYYFAKVKTYDVADTEIAEITEADYEIILPAGSGFSDGLAHKQLASSHSPTPQDTKDTGNTAITGATDHARQGTSDNHVDSEKGSSGTAENKNGSLSSEITVATIIQTYTPAFEYLQAQANGKIDALVGHAYGEYQAKKQNGDSISIPYFYQKYSSASKDLEKNTDHAFAIILAALETDLKKNGFSTSYANRFQEEYKAQKEAREATLLKKAKDAL